MNIPVTESNHNAMSAEDWNNLYERMRLDLENSRQENLQQATSPITNAAEEPQVEPAGSEDPQTPVQGAAPNRTENDNRNENDGNDNRNGNNNDNRDQRRRIWRIPEFSWVIKAVVFLLALALIFWILILVRSYMQTPTSKYASQRDGWNVLHKVMKSEIFGQHIAVETILNATYGHLTESQPRKALVLSLHGSLGTGKTFASQLIARYLYEDVAGGKNCVKKYLGPSYFNDRAKLFENQEKLTKSVVETVRNCANGRALFIFDEVSSVPSGIFDVLLPFVDFQDEIDGIDYRKTTFIFLSNTGSTEIYERFLEILRDNPKKREEITGHDFRELIQNGAFKEKGGLFHAEMISKRLVDYYVPFLPLERRHVALCAKSEIRRRDILYINPENVAEHIKFKEEFIDGPNNIALELSEDGCKRIGGEVNGLKYQSDVENPFKFPMNDEL